MRIFILFVSSVFILLVASECRLRLYFVMEIPVSAISRQHSVPDDATITSSSPLCGRFSLRPDTHVPSESLSPSLYCGSFSCFSIGIVCAWVSKLWVLSISSIVTFPSL